MGSKCAVAGIQMYVHVDVGEDLLCSMGCIGLEARLRETPKRYVAPPPPSRSSLHQSGLAEQREELDNFAIRTWGDL